MELLINFLPSPIKPNEFCDISNPEVATPPALEALPGENKTFLDWNRAIASGVQGILAPSATAIQPLSANCFACSSFNSFCVAQGKATSTLIDHGFRFRGMIPHQTQQHIPLFFLFDYF